MLPRIAWGVRKHAAVIRPLRPSPRWALNGVAAASDRRRVQARASSSLMADGEVLYEPNADRRMAMASITKLMTALVTLETRVPGT